MSSKSDIGALEQALVKALEYETLVRDVYRNAVETAKDPIGNKVFKILAEEEQGHIDYLEGKLVKLRTTGDLEAGGLKTVLPSKQAISRGVKKLEKKLKSQNLATEEELLRKALAVEEETSAFYRDMVNKLPRAGQVFFSPFLAIEDGHVAIVQAELDSLTQSGFWFDFQEFDLEAG